MFTYIPDLRKPSYIIIRGEDDKVLTKGIFDSKTKLFSALCNLDSLLVENFFWETTDWGKYDALPIGRLAEIKDSVITKALSRVLNIPVGKNFTAEDLLPAYIQDMPWFSIKESIFITVQEKLNKHYSVDFVGNFGNSLVIFKRAR